MTDLAYFGLILILILVLAGQCWTFGIMTRPRFLAIVGPRVLRKIPVR